MHNKLSGENRAVIYVVGSLTSGGLCVRSLQRLILHLELVRLLFLHTVHVPQSSWRRQPSQTLHRFRRIRGFFFNSPGDVTPFTGVTGVPGEMGEGSSPGESRGVFTVMAPPK